MRYRNIEIVCRPTWTLPDCIDDMPHLGYSGVFCNVILASDRGSEKACQQRQN
jgi:hypothetical protein